MIPARSIFSHRGRIVLHRVMLGAAVVPDSHAVHLPAPTYLVLRDFRLRTEVVKQFARSAQPAKASAQFGDEEVRLLEGGEMPAFRDFMPIEEL